MPDVQVRSAASSTSEAGQRRQFGFCEAEGGFGDGTTIVLEPEHRGAPAASTQVVKAYLPALHFASGAAVLHAGAVRIDGRGVGFAGVQSRGKSSLVAAMYDRGHRVITDDVLVLSERDGGWEALPSFPRISLRPETHDALGLNLERAEPGDGDSGDQYYDVADGFDPEAVPFDVLYVLEERGGVTDPTILSVDGRRAMDRLLEHAVRWPIPGGDDGVTRKFRQCAELAESLPVRTLRRPDDIEAMPDVIDRIEADVETL